MKRATASAENAPSSAGKPVEDPRVLSQRLRVQAAVGEVLRRRRLACGFTQTQLARRAGTHRPLVARAELGRHEIVIGTLLRYAWALGCSAADILREAEEVAARADQVARSEAPGRQRFEQLGLLDVCLSAGALSHGEGLAACRVEAGVC